MKLCNFIKFPCNRFCLALGWLACLLIGLEQICSFCMQEYKSVTSSPVYISPLDLGPKYSDKLGSGIQEYHKIYGENYCLGQLIYWHNQTNPEPDSNLARASRGCLSLPDIGSFYAKVQKPSRQRVYGPRTLRFMLARMVSLILSPMHQITLGSSVITRLCRLSCMLNIQS